MTVIFADIVYIFKALVDKKKIRILNLLRNCESDRYLIAVNSKFYFGYCI